MPRRRGLHRMALPSEALAGVFPTAQALLNKNILQQAAYTFSPALQENMAEDERRVAALFAAAGREGIPIQKRSLSSSELQAMMLQGDRLVIALVDKRKIDLWVSGEVRLESLVGMDDGYAGHYVLIVGLDKHRGEYFLRDPAAGCALVRVSCAALEQARKCFGTDEDLLCIAAPVKPQAGVSNGGCMEANGLLSVALKQDEAATGNSTTSTTPEAAQVQVVDS